MWKRNESGLYLLETHAHTSENSGCATLSAREVVRACHALGYRGLAITDHYQPGCGADARARAHFLTGFREALAVGLPLGMAILPGMEIRFVQGNEDFLVFGMTEEDILALPDDLCFGTAEDFHRLCRAKGWLLYQAHPFRKGLRALPPEALDGMEIHNGNPRHDSRNPLALAYAQRHGLGQCAGSDLHQPGDAGAAGIWVPEEALSPKGLADHLRRTPAPPTYVRCMA